MTKKTGLIVGAVAACLLLLIPIIKKEPYDGADLLSLLKIIVLLGGSIALRMSLPPADGKKAGGLYFVIQDIVFKLCVLLAGIVSLKHGFTLYEANLIWKALAFFSGGLALCFLFFYIADDSGSRFDIALPQYRPDTLKTASLKLLIALVLSVIGVFFLKKNYVPLIIITYAFVLIQLLLVFKFTGYAAGPRPAALPGEPAAYAKIISIVMIGASFYMFYMAFTGLQAYDIAASMLYFIIGSFLLGFAPSGRDYSQPPPKEGDNRTFDIIFCVFIYVLGLAISGWKLMDIPPGIHGDETLSVHMAQRLASGEMLPVVLEPPEYNGMTLLLYWLIVLAGKIGGVNIVTGRWLSVVVGAAGPVFVYLIVKNIWNRRAGVLASLLMTCFFMQIFYSRNCLQWIFVPSFAAASYYFFLKAMKRGAPAYFIAAGALISINMCFYSAAKASPLVVIFYLALMFARKETRGGVIANWRGLLLMAASMLFIFSPVIDYIIHYPAQYLARMNQVTMFHGFPANLNEFRALTDNMLKNIQMFMTESANGYCHNIPQKPFFNGFTAFAALLGLGYLLYNWKSESSSFLMFWVFFGLLPGFLSHLGPEDPYPARTVLSIPAVMILVALGLDRTLAKLESLWPRILKYVAPLVLLYFMSWYAYTSLNDYFVIFANDPHTQTYYKMGELMIAKKVIKNKNEVFHESTRLGTNFYGGIMPGFDGSRILGDDISVFEPYKLYKDNSMDAGLISEGILYKTLPIYKEYFPHAVVNTVWDRNFWMLDKTSPIANCYGWKYPEKVIELNQYMQWFYLYDAKVNYVLLCFVDIPRKDLDEGFTLAADFYRNGAKTGSGPVTYASVKSSLPYDRVTLTGLLDIPAYGDYEFKIDGGQGQIYINNSPVRGSIVLYKGLARIKADITRSGESNPAIMWRPRGEPLFASLGRGHTLNSNKLFGLMGTYSSKGKVIYKMLEPAIDYRFYYDLIRPPYRAGNVYASDITWDGYIDIDSDDTYSFQLDTLYDAAITIDGKLAYKKAFGAAAKEYFYPLKLGRGKRRVKITTDYTYISTLWGPGSTIRFMYKKSGWREFGPVTYNLLSPF
jgi:hypothetical protein